MSQGGAIGLGERDGVKVKAARQPTRLECLTGRPVVQVVAGGTHLVALADSAMAACTDMAIPPEERFGSTSQEDYADATCTKCREEEGPKGGELLFCDACNSGYHLECHDPPLESAPDGDWHCFNCKLERLSACAICGMQDENSSTLALCEAPDCVHFGACHIECMPPHLRPPLQLPEEQASSDNNSEDDNPRDSMLGTGVVQDGMAGTSKATTTKRQPQIWRPGDPKREWNLGCFHWYCKACAESSDEAARAPLYGVVCSTKKVAGLKPLEQAAAEESAKESAKDATAVSTDASMGDGSKIGSQAQTNGVQNLAQPLTYSQRKLLKSYYELCAKPDDSQLLLLAAVTDRSVHDVSTWFNDRTQDIQRKERQAMQKQREEARRSAEAQAQRQPGQQVHSYLPANAHSSSDKQGHPPVPGAASSSVLHGSRGAVGMQQPTSEEDKRHIKGLFDEAKQKGNSACASSCHALATCMLPCLPHVELPSRIPALAS